MWGGLAVAVPAALLAGAGQLLACAECAKSCLFTKLAGSFAAFTAVRSACQPHGGDTPPAVSSAVAGGPSPPAPIRRMRKKVIYSQNLPACRPVRNVFGRAASPTGRKSYD